jgi:hypothetical protein
MAAASPPALRWSAKIPFGSSERPRSLNSLFRVLVFRSNPTSVGAESHALASFSALFSLSSLLQNLINLFSIPQGFHVRIPWCNLESQSLCQRILLSFFYPLDLFLPLPLCFCSWVFAVFSVTTAFGIPVEITALLPPSHWSHKRVAKIIFSMGRALHV